MHESSTPRGRGLLRDLLAVPLGVAFVMIGVQHFTRPEAFDAIVHPVIASCYESHKPEDDDDGEDPSDDKFFDGDK